MVVMFIFTCVMFASVVLAVPTTSNDVVTLGRGTMHWSVDGAARGRRSSSGRFNYDVDYISTCTEISVSNGICTRMSTFGTVRESTCFSGSMTVMTPDGPKNMIELAVGDLVQTLDATTNTNVFARLTTWLHRAPTAASIFVKATIQTTNGELTTVIVSPEHYIFVNDSNSMKAQAMSATKVGDWVYLVNADVGQIVKMEDYFDHGIYTFATDGSDLVYVNGVLHHAWATNHVPVALLGALKPILVNSAPSVAGNTSDNISYVHWLVRAAAKVFGEEHHHFDFGLQSTSTLRDDGLVAIDHVVMLPHRIVPLAEFAAERQLELPKASSGIVRTNSEISRRGTSPSSNKNENAESRDENQEAAMAAVLSSMEHVSRLVFFSMRKPPTTTTTTQPN